MSIQYSKIALQTLHERYPLLPELPQYHHKWSYDIGVVLQGVRLAYQQTHDPSYLAYIQATMDQYINEAGHILNYDVAPMNSDFVNNGKLLLFLFKVTGSAKYRRAADLLYKQIQQMPRTSDGGFWHKRIYTEQMWLDGLYMVEPFYAEYILMFGHEDKITDIIHQFELIYQHTRDPRTGLLHHVWDSDKSQSWADPQTGRSPHAWGRALGWYCMALVDTYELLYDRYPVQARKLANIFDQVILAVRNVQDREHGVWYQVLDQGDRRGNYFEASASAMFVYAYAKGLRLGLLTGSNWYQLTQESYQALLQEFVFLTKEGWLDLVRNCQVAGLGGTDQRDGTFVYYISEPIITNDFKGYGAFIQAALEVEQLGLDRS